MQVEFRHNSLYAMTEHDSLAIEADDDNPGKYVVTLNSDVIGGLGYEYDEPDKADIRRMYALTSVQGTAMAETGICDYHYQSEVNRNQIREWADNDHDGQGFRDVTDNDRISCQFCYSDISGKCDWPGCADPQSGHISHGDH